MGGEAKMSYSAQSAFLASLVYDNGRVNQDALDAGARYVDSTGSVWELKAYAKKDNGYQGAVFQNIDTNEVVLANRGTEIGLFGGAGPTALESVRDLVTDAQMGIAALPGQFQAAEELLITAQRIANQSNAPLKVTGHSLGGSISQYLGALTGVATETFNAYGVGNILAELGIPVADPSKITNHVLHYDPVSMLPGSKMIGTTLDYKTPVDQVLDTPLGPLFAFLRIGGFDGIIEHILASHGIGNFQDGTLAAQAGQQIEIDVLNP
ncbi:MAG: hypothetical protein Q7T59_03645, partial [Candidatus Woesebacteria bacterium]|nr:hypothetical protein [Candidatus Woesebacteria bacterium]